MRRQEFADALLGIVERVPRKSVNEPDVSAARGELHCQTAIVPRELGDLIEHR